MLDEPSDYFVTLKGESFIDRIRNKNYSSSQFHRLSDKTQAFYELLNQLDSGDPMILFDDDARYFEELKDKGYVAIGDDALSRSLLGKSDDEIIDRLSMLGGKSVYNYMRVVRVLDEINKSHLKSDLSKPKFDVDIEHLNIGRIRDIVDYGKELGEN